MCAVQQHILNDAAVIMGLLIGVDVYGWEPINHFLDEMSPRNSLTRCECSVQLKSSSDDKFRSGIPGTWAMKKAQARFRHLSSL